MSITRRLAGVWLAGVVGSAVLCVLALPERFTDREPPQAPGVPDARSMRAGVEPGTSAALAPAPYPSSPRAAATQAGRRAGTDFRHDADKRRAKSPGGALQFRRLQQQDENGYVPPDGLVRAKRHVDQMRGLRKLSPSAPNLSVAGIGPAGWTWLGPGNIGGRVRSIVVNPVVPSTWFTGGVSGGIWKTVDSGAHWEPVNDFLSNLSITTMVIQPGNPSVMYAGTGEYAMSLQGAGIFKSTDGGETWTQLGSTASDEAFQYVNRLAMSPDGSVLLAATKKGIYRTTDGGATFALVLNTWFNPDFDNPMYVAFNPANSSKAIASAYDGKAWYSNDGGVSWTAATGLPVLPGGSRRAELAYAPSNPAIVYASVDTAGGTIYKSTNGGLTYTFVSTGVNYFRGPPNNQGWYDNAIWVDPTNPNTIIVGGVGLYRSTNGGVTLTEITGIVHVDFHAIVSMPGYNGSTNRQVLVGNDGGVYFINDIAAAPNGWVSKNNNLGITQFYGAAGSDSSGTIVGGTQDNGTLRYTAAAGPQAYTSMAGGDGGYAASDPTDPNYFYGEFQWLSLHRSNNGGASSTTFFGSAIPDYNGNSNFIAPFILDPNNPNTLLAGGRSLWRTTDAKFGNPPSFSSIKAPTPDNVSLSAIAVAPGNSDICWVGYNNGDVHKAIDCTAVSPTWTQVDTNSPGLPNRMVMRLTIDPSDPSGNLVYATFGGFSSGNLWRTANGGSSWTSVSGTGETALPPAPVHDLEIHPGAPSWLYAATEIGVFSTQDAGVTWEVPQDGPANVVASELFWMGPDLVVATFGRGLFKTTVLDGPYARLSSSSLSFGFQSLGTTSDPQTVTLTNKGTAPLNIIGLGLNPEEFPVHSNTCEVGTFLPAGAGCTVTLGFSPGATGTRTSALMINTDALNGEQLISLTGVGVSADVFFSDDLETGAPGWTGQQPWALTSEAVHGGSRAWSDSPGGTYGPNLNIALFSPLINLTNATNPQLSFWHRWQFGSDGYDSGNVWITTDGGTTYTRLATHTDANLAWSQSTIDLAAYAGVPAVQVVFQILSDASVTGDGWYIDDVVVANRAVTPSSFGKTSPGNGATGQPISPTLSWETSSGATSYEYCYDTLNNGVCDSSWRGAGASTSAAAGPLTDGTTYYWQVRAQNSSLTTEANGGAWWSFATPSVDLTPPAVTGVTPANGAAGVSIVTAVTVSFSEAINAATLTTGSFVLRNPANLVVLATLSYDAATRAGTLIPSAALAPATTYTATITGGSSGVRDLAGNPLTSSFVWSFTTVSAPVTVGLTIIGSSLDSGDSNFLNGSKVTTTAAGQVSSMSVYVGSIDSVVANRQYQLAIYTDTAGRPGTLIAASGNGTLVANAWNTLAVSAPLAGSTNYWLMFNTNGRTGSVNNMYYNSGAVGRGAYSFASVPYGNWPVTFPASITTNMVFSLFATFGADTTPPAVTGATPANGATGVSTATPVTATFSEAINASTLTTSTFVLRNPAGSVMPGAVSYNAGTRVATLSPSAALTASTTYTATIAGNGAGVKDVAGNPLASDFVWSFTTVLVDTTPPAVTSTTPVAGATGVGTAAAVTATFSEAINATTLTTATFVLRDPANAVVPAAVTYNAGTRVATLAPSAALAPSTMYTTTITGNSAGVKDMAGNPLAGNFVWSFTTTAAVLPMGLPTIGGSLDSGDSNSLNGSKVTTPAAGQVASMSVYVGTVDSLVANRQYQLAIYTDNAGRPGTLLAASATGTLVANAWNTLAVSASLGGGTNYWLMFNTNGRSGSVNNMYYNSGAPGQGAYSTQSVPFGTWPGTFPASTTTNFAFSLFATFGSDTTPPAVTGATPANGATGVSTATAVTATFGEAINASTITASTFVLRNPANAAVTAAVNYNTATRVATLAPSAALSASTTYTATITAGGAGVKDMAGNPLASDYVWSFTTASGSVTVGLKTTGSSLDSGDSNFLNGSKVTTTAAGQVSSMSVYVGALDSLVANRQYQLAIYTDNSGRPGTLVAASASGTLAANAWNTVPVSASLAAGTTYWLMFNTNGRTEAVNNMYYNSGAPGQGAYSTIPVPFGAWPATFPAAITTNLVFSLFATFGP